MLLSIKRSIWLASLASLGLVSGDAASDLHTLLTDYPSLTGLRQIVINNGPVINTLIGENKHVTIMAPTDKAVADYASEHGKSLSDEPTTLLTDILSYHILAADITSSNFSSQKGITIPTLLKGELYNNRTAGAVLVNKFGAGPAQGQVVFAHRGLDGGFRLQAGPSDAANITALDKAWPRGYLQVVDKVLELPKNCTETMEEEPQLKTLYDALEDTNVYDSIDLTPNVTCLGPNNVAFETAGNPQLKLNTTQLAWFVKTHVLPQPLYLDHLQNGMEFKNLRNETVKVTLEGNDVFFNNAKVVQSNVLTNNGVIYVLDRIMTAEKDTAEPTPSPTPSSTSSSSPSSTGAETSPTKSSAAHASTSLNQYLTLSIFGGLTALLHWM